MTGIGLVTGLGMNRERTWHGLKQGRSAARVLEWPRPDVGPPYLGCPVPHSDQRPTEQLIKAAIEAVADARIGPGTGDPIDRDRAGTVIGFSKGDLRRLALRADGRHDRIAWGAILPNGAASGCAHVWDLRGPCLAPVAACATGVVAVLRAADLIRQGVCDVVLAGAGDSQLEPLTLAAFRRMRILARQPTDPTEAARPLDRRRSGFVPGAGAAVLVLERAGHARARGVRPYTEVAGGALGADAFAMTDPNPDPANLAALIGRALENAGAEPSELDHVNLHATATRGNDPLECRALRRALGPAADRVACTANKAQIGHLLGAAGAAELAITCLSIRDGFIPPTLNLDDPDPACDLDATPLVGRPLVIATALKLAIGFGGHLAATVLRRPDGPRREPLIDDCVNLSF